MKAVKIILIILVVLVGLPLIIALFVDKDFSHEESIVINAPINEVWNETNTLKKMDAWSPWTKMDDDIQQLLNFRLKGVFFTLLTHGQ